jgi:hypothetical protein
VVTHRPARSPGTSPTGPRIVEFQDQVTTASWEKCDRTTVPPIGGVRPFVDNAGAGPYLRMGPAGPAVRTAPARGFALFPAPSLHLDRGLRASRVRPVERLSTGDRIAAPASAVYRKCSLAGVPVTGSANYRERKGPGAQGPGPQGPGPQGPGPQGPDVACSGSNSVPGIVRKLSHAVHRRACGQGLRNVERSPA